MKAFIFFICVSFTGLQCVSAQFLTSFGSNQTTEAITQGSVTQTPTGINWTPSVVLGDTWQGVFLSAYDWSGVSDDLAIVMSITGTNPNLFFDVELFDASFNSIVKYQQDTSGVTLSPTTVALSNILQAGTLDFSNVKGIGFTWAGDGSINASITDIVAVPEPSTGLLIGAGSVVFLLLRRRRKVV
jgi:hypothetical protein